MSSSITLSAATRQNLLSLQDTASLLATTQSRLSTGKKVNSALDNPINFFTANNLSSRSTELSSLLDGISNGVQTIQAANTGLSKLQNLTSQLKSTAQQALAATNAFTSKAASVSTALSGASATNLLSTGPTTAVSDKSVGTLTNGLPTAAVAATVTGSVDYKPTAAPSTMRGTTFTATTPTAAKAAGVSAFSAPGNAVAGTVTGGSAFASAGFDGTTKLTIKAGTGTSERTIEVNLAQNITADQAVEAIKTRINAFNADPANPNNRSTVAVSLDRDGKLAFTGDTNGDQIRVSASGTGAAGTGFGATAAVSANNVAAQSQKLTIGTREITISGGRAGDDAADVRKAVLQAINDATSAGSPPTGVTATFESDGGTGQRLVLSGRTDGTNFTVTGSPGNTLGFGSTALTTANGAPAASQTLTINGTQITIAGGGDIDAAVTAINNQKGTTGVSAAKDPADATRLLLTGKADGSAFTVASSNPASSGFAATPTSTSLAATVSGVFTPDGTAATTTASGAFQAPAGAVAGTLTAAYSAPTAGGARLAITSGAGGSGNTFTVDLAAGDSKEIAARKLNDAFGTSGIKAAVSGGNLVFTGKADGSALSITGAAALTGFTAPVSATNAVAAQSGTVTGGTYAAPGAGGAKLTIKSGTDSPITVELAQGDAIGTALGKIQAGLGQNSGISVALNAGGNALVFTGKTDGSALTVSSSGPGAGIASASTSTNADATTKGSVTGATYVAPGAGGVRLAISDTANTTPISVDLAAGASIDAAVTAIGGALTAAGSSITVGKNAGGTALVFTASANNANVTVSPASAAGGFSGAGTASTGNQVGTAGTVTGTASYAAPGASGAKLTITSGSGATATTYAVDLTSTETSATIAAAKIQAELTRTNSGITVDGSSGRLVFTGKADGSALNIASTGPGGGFTATPSLSTGQKAADSQTITIKGATGGDQQVTIRGGAAGDSDAKVLAGALAAINDKSGTTGVTASASADGKIMLKGAATGAGFTVTGGPNSTLGFGTSPVTADNGKASAAQTLTINGSPIPIAAGANQAAAIAAINAATTTTGVSAAVDPENAGKIKLTGKADGSAFTVQSSNAASSGFSGITQRVNNNQGAAQSVTVNGTEIAIAGSATLDEAIAAINAKSSITGVAAGKDQAGTKLTFTGGADGNSFTIKGSEYNTLGVASTEASVAGISDPGQTSLISTLGFKGGDSFSVNGQTVNLTATDTIGSLVQKVGAATNGAVTASYDATTNKFSFTAADSRTAVQLGDGSTATSKVSNLGFTATDFAAGAGQPSSQSALAGKSITVQVGSGTSMNTATITFGNAPGQVSTLAQLNEALAPANAQATIDSLTGKISITTSNDVGAQNLSVIASGIGNPFTTGSATANLGGDGLNARNNLVVTYNDLLKQMDQLASDAGFNGVNLLSGDNLTINFNEKGSSSLKVQGSATNAASLGLSAVGQTNFQESSAIKKIVDQINSASSQLQSRAAALGSNLAVVQNRQDFTKQIITVLDTGAANLTSADLNEEAANSQALSTRNSLAISALSLANQSQQGILQLLR